VRLEDGAGLLTCGYSGSSISSPDLNRHAPCPRRIGARPRGGVGVRRPV